MFHAVRETSRPPAMRRSSIVIPKKRRMVFPKSRETRRIRKV
jgi:hypothetical protein